MELTVQTRHVASVVRKRNRNAERAIYIADVSVNVATVTGVEAPVATRRKALDRDKAPGEFVETRWFGGSHWLPKTMIGENGSVIVSAEFLSEGVRQRHSLVNPFYPKSCDQVRYNSEIDPFDEYRMINDDGVAGAEIRANSIAASLLVIDGQVWRRVHEPVYRLKRNYSRDRRIDVEVLTDAGEIENCINPKPSSGKADRTAEPFELFGANQVDQIVAFHRARNDTPDVDFGEGNWMEILIPESVGFNVDHLAFQECVESLLGSGCIFMNQWSEDRIMSWLDVRREFQIGQRSKIHPNSDLGDLCDVLRVYAEDHMEGYDKDKTLAIIERWESRPIDFEFDGEEDAPFLRI